MPKNIIFHGSFLVSGIMCHAGCGSLVQSALSDLSGVGLPSDAEVHSIDAQPKTLGIHEISISIQSEQEGFNQSGEKNKTILAGLTSKLTEYSFQIIDEKNLESEDESKWPNRINILVNLVAMFGILVLSLIYPPSLLLTVALTAVTTLTTAFTGRNYLSAFLNNLRNKKINDMSSTISLGWLLSLTHTLYHSITMPLASSFSMVFMSFIMPVMLIAMVNGMDEIKRLVLQKSKTIHLKGMKSLFPQMAEEYLCHQVPQEAQEKLMSLMETQPTDVSVEEFLIPVQTWLSSDKVKQSKQSLQKGMLIQVNAGDCFPVDCILVQGNTLVDASLLTGEPQQPKKLLDTIPAGAINLGQAVTVYVTNDSYNSTVNKLLFRSNRAPEKSTSPDDTTKFTSLYTSLIMVSIVASIITPLSLGVFTVPLVLKNVIGILFAVCPCTIAIAHQLPQLLSIYQRNNKNILLRNENMNSTQEMIHTVVFDKTGTLTTGRSKVESYVGLDDALWQKIHLLEQCHGAGHPLANAINSFYDSHIARKIVFTDISNPVLDPKNRGLSATVQGKPIHIGNLSYMQEIQESQIVVAEEHTSLIQSKLLQGYTPIYVAEGKVYKGVIFIQHEPRSDILAALKRLKNEGKTLIMLTGDNSVSAMAFNQQISAKAYPHSEETIFEPQNIHAEQQPHMKEAFLRKLMKSFEPVAAPKKESSKQGFLSTVRGFFGGGMTPSEPKKSQGGVWFVGDGLNDAPCARIVTEKKGVSCAMNSTDKAAFFTDISLNGSLAYLFEHHKLDRFFQKNIRQNQALLVYSAIAFLAFIISFSIAGLAVSPLIPMLIMMSTTGFTLLNCYRVKLSVDEALDKHRSWFRGFFVSDASVGLAAGASTLLIVGLLISTVMSKGLGLPALTAGGWAAIGSASALSGGILLTLFTLTAVGYLIFDQFSPMAGDDAIIQNEPSVIKRQRGTPQLATTPAHQEVHKGLFSLSEPITGDRMVGTRSPTVEPTSLTVGFI